ncbi:putative odorant receptor 92a [Pectinophora gossypiella]|uniref:putative odorant receptor 92a n=1 Tax=Pectinophora gossypiella TaxID=13191 RepID=UPI00214EC3ED|nr:putative odorant receptor 92a [Pectinophora gossypiella]
MYFPEFEDIFKQIKKNLKMAGIPADNSMLGLKFYILFVNLMLMAGEEIAFFTSKMSSQDKSFLELTALAPCIGIGVLSLVKIVCIVLKRCHITELMNQLGKLYQEIVDDSKQTELRKTISRKIVHVKSFTTYYFVLNLVLISVYNFSTLLFMLYSYIKKETVKLVLPYDVIVPFSTTVWYNWLVVYVHSISCGFICVLYYTTVDALYCNLTSLICSNYSVISNEIEQLTPNNAHTLNNIVKRHQYILKLSDVLEEIFALPNLYNVLVASVEICVLSFNIMTGDWTKIPGFILFLLSQILQILVMSVFGENLIRESSRVGEAAFKCEWYNMEEKYKKMILTILIRSHKPKQLTAYNFSVICHRSFTKIISTAWSYFTILKTVYNPAEEQ